MNSCVTKLGKIAWVILCVPLLLFANTPKIIGLSTDGGNRLEISFDRTISKSIFKNFQFNSEGRFRDICDIEAILTIKPLKNSTLGESTKLRIAQNSPQKVRVVLDSPSEIQSTLELSKKRAFITVKEGKSIVRSLFDEIDTTTLKDPKDATNVAIPAPVKTTPKSPKSPKETPVQSPKKEEIPTLIVQQNKKEKSNKRIVLDPGHGGKDCGAIGVGKVCEKVIALNVAKALAKELRDRGYKVFLTREKDVFINLRARTKFANDKEADLFISIHANAVPKNKKTKFQGIETYFLSTARSERAKNAAALENKDDIETMNYFSKQSFLNALNSQRLVASNKLAIDIQFGLLKATRDKFQGVVDGGVREGPFWVLAGALMPSVLLELGYVTHPLEGTRLAQKNYQKQLILGIANGIDGYFQKNL